MTRVCLAVVVAAALITALCKSPSAPSEGSAPADGLTLIPVGVTPSAVAAADVNADGLPDVLVGNAGGGSLTVLLGDGRGGFTPSAGSPFSSGQQPLDFATGDFNRDGRLDVAIANHDTSAVTVLLGDGRGAFAPALASPFFTGCRPHVHSVAAGDLNADGLLDLVVESADTDSVQVIYGDGAGGFSSPAPFFVGALPYYRVRVGDLDGDGRPDVAVALSRDNAVAVLRGDGRGSLTPMPGSPFPTSGSNPLTVGIGDLNGDRRPDIAVIQSNGIAMLLFDGLLFRGDPRGPFAAGAAPSNLALGDLNGDGIADVIVSNVTSHDVTLLLSGPSGPASERRILRVGRMPQEVAIGDFNRDGRGDFVVANSQDNTVGIWLNR